MRPVTWAGDDIVERVGDEVPEAHAMGGVIWSGSYQIFSAL
jgi:hypothetical protein